MKDIPYYLLLVSPTLFILVCIFAVIIDNRAQRRAHVWRRLNSHILRGTTDGTVHSNQ
jgi:hypothetical protein